MYGGGFDDDDDMISRTGGRGTDDEDSTIGFNDDDTEDKDSTMGFDDDDDELARTGGGGIEDEDGEDGSDSVSDSCCGRRPGAGISPGDEDSDNGEGEDENNGGAEERGAAERRRVGRPHGVRTLQADGTYRCVYFLFCRPMVFNGRGNVHAPALLASRTPQANELGVGNHCHRDDARNLELGQRQRDDAVPAHGTRWDDAHAAERNLVPEQDEKELPWLGAAFPWLPRRIPVRRHRNRRRRTILQQQDEAVQDFVPAVRRNGGKPV